jgi:dinuclear metal center YbgI/SA1388 family protein
LAEAWDNVGLQAGQGDWLVRKIWVALDPLPDVVAAATQQKVDLLITHHPLIFPHIQQIDWQTPLGKILAASRRAQLAIFAAHTNLDTAGDGLNDQLAKLLQVRPIKVLSHRDSESFVKLVVDIAADREPLLWETLFAADNDQVTRLPSSVFRVQGSGAFEADISHGAAPKERPLVRCAFTVRSSELSRLLQNLRQGLPEDQLAYTVYSMSAPMPNVGLGRVGQLSQATTLEALASQIKTQMGLDRLRVAGRSDRRVRRVALCTGSGSELLKDFVASGADVYISGDLKYHDARTIEALDLGLIDIGHFASEHIVVGWLTQRLRDALKAHALAVTVEACALERDPFWDI